MVSSTGNDISFSAEVVYLWISDRAENPRVEWDWRRAKDLVVSACFCSGAAFLNDCPTVKREQALGVLELMRERLLTEYETAA